MQTFEKGNWLPKKWTFIQGQIVFPQSDVKNGRFRANQASTLPPILQFAEDFARGRRISAAISARPSRAHCSIKAMREIGRLDVEKVIGRSVVSKSKQLLPQG